MSNLHTSASIGRILGAWSTRRVDSTDAIIEELDIVRDRSHDLYRSNLWYKVAVDKGVTSEIGSGIVPTPTTSSPELNKQLKLLWTDYARYVPDHTGVLRTFYAIESQIARTRRISGGCIVVTKRLRPSRNKDMVLPLQFMVLEPEYCPHDFNKAKLKNGNEVRGGIEVNKYNKVVALYLYKQHPDRYSETHVTSLNDLVRVNIKDVVHHYIPQRAGVLRAMPEMQVGIPKVRAFDDYDYAELIRKQSRSAYTGTIEENQASPDTYGAIGADGIDPLTGLPSERDHAGQSIVDIESGTFVEMPKGKTLNLFDGDKGGEHDGVFKRSQLLALAVIARIPYESMTGDFSGINDRVWKAIMTQHIREIKEIQDLYFIPQVCDNVWREFVNSAIVTGKITIPPNMTKWDYMRSSWVADKFDSVNELQQVKSDVLKFKYNFKPRSKIVETYNSDFTATEVDELIKEDMLRAESLDIVEDAEVENTLDKENE